MLSLLQCHVAGGHAHGSITLCRTIGAGPVTSLRRAAACYFFFAGPGVPFVAPAGVGADLNSSAVIFFTVRLSSKT